MTTESLYRLLTDQGIDVECAGDVANTFNALIHFHNAKTALESKGYLIRSDDNGDYDLHDMNTHQVVKWHYDEALAIFELILPLQYSKPMFACDDETALVLLDDMLIDEDNTILEISPKGTPPLARLIPIEHDAISPDSTEDDDFDVMYCKQCTIKAGHEICHGEPYCQPELLTPVNLDSTEEDDQDGHGQQSSESPLLFPLRL